MKGDIEQRAFAFDVRANEDDRGTYIEGRPIVYQKETIIGDMFKEEICAGALDGTDLTDVRFLVNHDTSKIPLARSRNNNENSTMQLNVDEKGLKIRAYLDIENNTEAKALYSAVERGDITGMSFLFGVEKEKWEDLKKELPKRFIEKISTVIEVSAVTFPAYKDTEIMARNKEALESAKNALDSARAAVDTAGDNAGGLESRNAESELQLLREKIKIVGGSK